MNIVETCRCSIFKRQ